MCSSHHSEMVCLENPYFNLNEILLRVTGLWPFQQSKFARIQFSLFFSIMIAAVIFQVRQCNTFKPFQYIYYTLCNFDNFVLLLYKILHPIRRKMFIKKTVTLKEKIYLWFMKIYLMIF